jgi:3-hydroxyacyl-CoA dehydrogenase
MTDTAKSVEDSDLVVEAIIENLKLKQDLFASLDKVTIIISWFSCR